MPNPFNLFDPRILTLISEKGLNLCTTISEGLKSTCKDILAQGVTEGWDIRRIRDELMNSINGAGGSISRFDAERISRTEVIRSAREAGVEADKQSGVVEAEMWVASPDACVEECAPLDGMVFDFDEIPETHPNCLLPENKVLVSNLQAGSKAFYSGDASEIRTRGGNNLTITPNHMILTPQGFIKAKFLHEGDYIIASPRSQRIVSIINPNDNHTPSFIEDKWNSLLMQENMVSRVMPTSAPDFYGDAVGFYGNINIVDTNSFLGNDTSNSSTTKHISKLNLNRRNTLPLNFFSFCSLRKVANGTLHSPDGIMGRFRQRRPFFWCGICHSNKHRLANVSRDNAPFNQSSAENRPAYTNLSSKFLFRFSQLIAGDEIVKIRNFNYSGQVYDLQSKEELFFANNVVVKNCRCSLRSVLKE